MKKNILQCRQLFTAAVFFSFILGVNVGNAAQPQIDSPKPVESFQFSVYKLLIKVGSVELEYFGPTEMDGQMLELVRFTAKGLNFTDQDDIYLHPVSLFPVFVNRKVSLFGKDEDILEYYDAAQGSVKIVKTVNDIIDQQIIDKDGPLENIYGFIHRFRTNKNMKKGQKVFVRLPTKDITMIYVDQREMSWKGEKRKVAYLESDPKQFRIWLDLENGLVPLRIDGAVGFGSTAMILQDFSRH